MNICPNCSYLGEERACPRDGFPLMDESVFTHVQGEVDLLGKVFDHRYQVEEQIGRGGMGCVWKARHLTMQHDVALKVMRAELSRNLSAVRRFYQEARSSAQLKHPNTIRVYDFGASEDGLLYLAMEYLNGEPLSALVRRRGPLPPLEAIAIARQVCGSLDEAHDRGMVHRDLKPDNIYLTQVHRIDNFVKVLDFGIAKVVGSAAAGPDALTSTGFVVGTPKYVSPEQAQARLVDRRSDLYSLGIILYEMLTGRVPFQAPSAAALLVQHVSVTPPPLPDQVGGAAIPGELQALVAQILSKLPEDRPPTAAEVERRLVAIVPLCRATDEWAPGRTFADDGPTVIKPREGSPVWASGSDGGAHVTPVAAFARTATDRRGAALAPPEPTGDDVQWPPVRHRGLWAALVAGMLAVIGVVVALLVVPYGEQVGPADGPDEVASRHAVRAPVWAEARAVERRKPEPTQVVAAAPAGQAPGLEVGADGGRRAAVGEAGTSMVSIGVASKARMRPAEVAEAAQKRRLRATEVGTVGAREEAASPPQVGSAESDDRSDVVFEREPPQKERKKKPRQRHRPEQTVKEPVLPVLDPVPIEVPVPKEEPPKKYEIDYGL